MLRAGDALEASGRGQGWRAGWRSVSGPLRGCLGDPLADPPAADPTGVRSLERVGEDWRWVIGLGGHNRCRLEGSLTLAATADRADATALVCGAATWQEGGRDCALENLRAYARARATADWPALGPEDRAAWLMALESDPAAATLLEELRAMP